MNKLELIQKQADHIEEITVRQLKNEHQLLTDALSLYVDGLQAIPPFQDNDSLLVRISLLSHNLNNLNLAFDASCRGFYIQALSILKNVYETWLAFWYLAQFPEHAELWLDPSWEKRPFKAETMRNKMDHPGKETKTKLKDFYEELNRFAHTDPSAVLSRLDHQDTKMIIGIGVQFDPLKFRTACYAFCLWIGNMLDAISALIPSEHTWQANYDEMFVQLMSFINAYNSEIDNLEANRRN